MSVQPPTGALFVGTPAYVAPEAIEGSGHVDSRADLYSPGCMAFWLLTGRPVFDKPTVMETFVAHARDVPEPPGRYSAEPVSPQLDSLVLRGLETSPDSRPASAEEVDRDLHVLDDRHRGLDGLAALAVVGGMPRTLGSDPRRGFVAEAGLTGSRE